MFLEFGCELDTKTPNIADLPVPPCVVYSFDGQSEKADLFNESVANFNDDNDYDHEMTLIPRLNMCNDFARREMSFAVAADSSSVSHFYEDARSCNSSQKILINDQHSLRSKQAKSSRYSVKNSDSIKGGSMSETRSLKK